LRASEGFKAFNIGNTASIVVRLDAECQDCQGFTSIHFQPTGDLP